MKTFIILGKFYLALGILLLSSACLGDRPTEKDIAFQDVVSIGDVNSKIGLRLLVPEDAETLEVGDSITLSLENRTRDNIVFPSNYGIRIYTYDNTSGSWTEIPNRFEYFPLDGSQYLLPKGNDGHGTADVTVGPYIMDTTQSIDVRIFVEGRVEKEGELTEEQVSAYIDVTLHERDTCEEHICVYLEIQEPILFNQPVEVTTRVELQRPVTMLGAGISVFDSSVIVEEANNARVSLNDEMDMVSVGWVQNTKSGVTRFTTTLRFTSEGQKIISAEAGDSYAYASDTKTIYISELGGTIVAPYGIFPTMMP